MFLKTVLADGTAEQTVIREMKARAAGARGDIEQIVRGVMADVQERGWDAVVEYAEKFDGKAPYIVEPSVLDAAYDACDPKLISALEKAAANIRDYHEQMLVKSWEWKRSAGETLGQTVRGLSRVGIYVPGGTAAYPSSVLMNAIPAKVAGVGELIMVTPPTENMSNEVLAAAKIAGVDKVIAIGGTQAIAALTYGAGFIPQVDKIVGPGNAFVAAAKQIVSGDVGIDMVAGPSEVCVLADATAKPMVVAADLMAQAEHDPLAACYLVTCDEQFAREVEAGIDILVAQSPRAEITRASLDNEGTIVVAADMAAAVEAVNTVAPEHLELHCKDAMGLLGGIRNAGAIFVGAWSSEPLGDYVAGPNHTLPTGGTAMFSNPLSVEEFVKRSSVICYTPEGLLSDAPATQRLAEAEGLWAHALSAALRRRVLEQGEDAVSAASLAAADLTKVAWPGDAVATVAEGVDLAAAGADGVGATGKEA